MKKFLGLRPFEFLRSFYRLATADMPSSFRELKDLEVDLDIGEDLLAAFEKMKVPPENIAGSNLLRLLNNLSTPEINFATLQDILKRNPSRRTAMLFAHGPDSASELYAEGERVIDSKDAWIYEHSLGEIPRYSAQFILSCNKQGKRLAALRVPLFYVNGIVYLDRSNPHYETFLSLPKSQGART